MITKLNHALLIIVALLSILVFFASAYARNVKDPVDYVDPNIGTIAHLLVATAPTVQLPHGIVELSHNPSPETRDRYLASKIASFSIRALPPLFNRNNPFMDHGNDWQASGKFRNGFIL